MSDEEHEGGANTKIAESKGEGEGEGGDVDQPDEGVAVADASSSKGEGVEQVSPELSGQDTPPVDPKGFPWLTWKSAGWAFLEMSVVCLLLFVVFIQRLLDLEQIEVGGDALKVWEFARNLVMGGDFPTSLNHHTSRFGLVLPTLLSQLAFGSQATTYFIGPLVCTVLLHLWVYLIGRKLSGPVAGAVGVLLLLGFEPMVRASSQILPEGFGPMYTAFAIYAALLYSDAKTKTGRWVALWAAGLGIVFAYGAKMIYLYYAPGVAFLVWFGGAKGGLMPARFTPGEAPSADASLGTRAFYWLRTSKLVVPGVLTLVVVGLVLIESVFLSSVTDATSRLEVVEGSHGGIGARGPRINQVSDFFALYTRAPHEWVPAFAGGVLAWLGLSAFARDKRSKLIALTLLVYVLLQTFVVRRLSPLTPWVEPHPRYLLAMAGPIAMVIGLFVGDAISVFTRGRDAVGPLEGRHRAIALVVALGLFASAGSSLSEEWERKWGKKTAWHKTQETAESLTAAFDAGLPIVAETPQGKPAWAAAALFIDPHSIVDEDGKPVLSRTIMRRYGQRGRYVARGVRTIRTKGRRLDNAVATRASRRRCALVLRQSIRFMSGRMTFKKDCESLEAEFKNNPKAGMEGPPKPRSRSRRPTVNRARPPSPSRSGPSNQTGPATTRP